MWTHRELYFFLQKNTKYVSRLYGIASSDDHCVLACPQSGEGVEAIGAAGDGGDLYPYTLSLCNSLGTTVDTKQVSLEPLFVSMASNYVFAASKEYFFVWHFRTAQTWTHIETCESKPINLPDPVPQSP